jgi:hypothetical protein
MYKTHKVIRYYYGKLKKAKKEREVYAHEIALNTVKMLIFLQKLMSRQLQSKL